MSREMQKTALNTRYELFLHKITFFKFEKRDFYRQGVAGLKSGRAPTESFPMESLPPEKEGVQNTFYDDGAARVVEGLAHTWVAPSPSGMCSAVLLLFFLLYGKLELRRVLRTPPPPFFWEEVLQVIVSHFP